MRTPTTRPISGLISIVVAMAASASALGATNAGPEAGLSNWSAPAFWSPAPAPASGASPRALASSTTDLSGPLPFVPLTPCRVADTRTASGFTGSYGPPSLAAQSTRAFTISGQCGIPASAQAVSFLFTAVNMTGNGSLRAFPYGAALPSVGGAVLLWAVTTPGAVIDAAVVPIGGSPGALNINLNGPVGTSTDFVLDVNGYYASTLNGGEQLLITANIAGAAIAGFNTSGDGVQGQTTSGTSSGVYGKNTSGGNGVFGASASGNGVFGQSTSSSGVYGLSAGAGVWGDSTGFDGVHGHTTVGTASGVAGFNDSNGAGTFGSSVSGDGVFGTGSTGLHGSSIAGWGAYGHSTVGDGVHGDTIGNNASGVAGINGGGGFGVFGGANAGAGVVGNSQSGDGVYGTSQGDYTASGVHAVGMSYCSGHPNVFCNGGSAGLTVEGVANFNNSLYLATDLQVAGYKNFVAPHPSDPTKQIAFVSLEGPESGTYFRGTAHLVAGYAEISVPESFRLVTSPQGLTVVATATGTLASVACVSKSLDKIAFQGSADVDFDYMVNGVRAGYENYEAVQPNFFFVPSSAAARNFLGLPAEAVRRLKASGILNEDGTLNLDTAHKLGWDQRPGWNRVSPAPAAATQPAPASN